MPVRGPVAVLPVLFNATECARRSAGLAQMGDAGYEKLTDIRKAPHGFHG
jgi:hypothetical protein